MVLLGIDIQWLIVYDVGSIKSRSLSYVRGCCCCGCRVCLLWSLISDCYIARYHLKQRFINIIPILYKDLNKAATYKYYIPHIVHKCQSNKINSLLPYNDDMTTNNSTYNDHLLLSIVCLSGGDGNGVCSTISGIQLLRSVIRSPHHLQTIGSGKRELDYPT